MAVHILIVTFNHIIRGSEMVQLVLVLEQKAKGYTADYSVAILKHLKMKITFLSHVI